MQALFNVHELIYKLSSAYSAVSMHNIYSARVLSQFVVHPAKNWKIDKHFTVSFLSKIIKSEEESWQINYLISY